MKKTMIALLFFCMVVGVHAKPPKDDETKGFATRAEAEKVVKALENAKVYIFSSNNSPKCDNKNKSISLVSSNDTSIKQMTDGLFYISTSGISPYRHIYTLCWWEMD